MATYLEPILAAHRAAASGEARPIDRLVELCNQAPPVRPFAAALGPAGGAGLAVIAEIKRRSPSRGDLAPDLDPALLAKAYAGGGAAALSVLTDEAFFAGSPADLEAAREAVDLAVLRKDFTVCEHDVCDARLMGADAVLLIVAALDDAELRAFADLAAEVSMDALVEVHDEWEVDRAMEAGARLIGVNQRDLHSFEVDTDRAVRVARHLPEGVVAVAESGIEEPAHAVRLHQAGYTAVLVGEALVRSEDPAGAIAAMRSACS